MPSHAHPPAPPSLVLALLGSLITGLGAVEGDIDYGAGRVNSLGRTAGLIEGGREDFDYLALRDHDGPSGVPLGGIGVGSFAYCPDGRFSRICINNCGASDQAPVIHDPPGTFLAVWDGGKAQLLHRARHGYAGMATAQHTTYRGLFPIAQCTVDDLATVRAWSGLVPQDTKDSSLPLAWIEVELANPDHHSRTMAVALSWQDVIGRDLLDIRDLDLLKESSASVWQREGAINRARKQGRPTWTTVPRVATTASPFAVGTLGGLRQHSAPLQPVMKTYQNYNNEMVILAERGEGSEISLLPAYDTTAAEPAWSAFRSEGRFAAAGEAPLYDPRARHEMASAVAVRVTLPAGGKRTLRFLVAWFQPELVIDRAKDPPGTFFGKADYARFYHNAFSTITDLIAYGAKERQRIERSTCAWHEPILASTYPDWLKFKLINSAYTIFTNTILNKAGDFTVLEGGMGGLAGTMDQRLSAHPFYHKFFTALDRSDLELFGHSTGNHGQILHFDGHYYFGLASRDGTTPVPDQCMNDNTGGWLVQVAKDWQQHGDAGWLGQFRAQVGRGIDYLRDRIHSQRFAIISGPTTYDDFWHPPLYAYNASTYPCFLRAGAVLCRALGDDARASMCEDQAGIAAQDAMRALWNGRFFAYGAELDGSRRRDDIVFSGQLAGQFLSRYCGWNDVFPHGVNRAAVVAQLKTNVGNSVGHYAPKVWLWRENQAMSDPSRPDDRNADSTCWPFYLESYTAMPAILAGFVDDGLEIMRHIQLMHLRNGWTWSQNLWRLGELTYVAAPVTWFITDVLAGTALDLPSQTIFLAPLLRPGETRAVLPVFFARFWGTVTVDRPLRRLTLAVTRVFDGPAITLRTVVAQPAGRSTGDQRRMDFPPFLVQEGALLDLSPQFDRLMDAVIEPPVLPHHREIPFVEVMPAIVQTPSINPPGERFVDRIAVEITSETMGAESFLTTDGSDPRTSGRKCQGRVALTAETTVRAAARLGSTWSPVRQRIYRPEIYRKPDCGMDTVTGRWRWRYYEGDGWRTLPDVTRLSPVASGECAAINLEMRRRDQRFAVVFEGAFQAARRGVYTFHLTSDDGSRLTVGGKDVLDHDGIHAADERTLSLPLEPGCHSLRLEYFQNEGGWSLGLHWDEPR